MLRLSQDAAGAVARVRPMMERQVTQMVRLIDDLLDVSRITSGKIQLQPEPTPVVQLVRDAMEGHRAALDAGQLTADVALPPDAVYVYADHARFVQILSNLLHNAIKFTDPGGTIAITGVVAGANLQDACCSVGERHGAGTPPMRCAHLRAVRPGAQPPASGASGSASARAGRRLAGSTAHLDAASHGRAGAEVHVTCRRCR